MKLMYGNIGLTERRILEQVEEEEYLADVEQYLARIQRPRSEMRAMALG